MVQHNLSTHEIHPHLHMHTVRGQFANIRGTERPRGVIIRKPFLAQELVRHVVSLVGHVRLHLEPSWLLEETASRQRVERETVGVDRGPHDRCGHFLSDANPLAHHRVEESLPEGMLVPPAVVMQPVAPEGEVDVAKQRILVSHLVHQDVLDVVAVEVLNTGIVPPIANFTEVDPHLGSDLKLSRGGAHPCKYAIRFAAGFGSQIALALYGVA